MNKKDKRKFFLNISIFVVIMILTFWSIFHNQDFTEMADSMKKMSGKYMGIAIVLAIFFVSAEGCMIWYLLKGIGEQTTLCRCISYSFIGFFFSGITPSATGGQPMQLYYMGKDGNSLSSASVVLMTVAIIYKFVLVLIGIGIVLFWRAPLKEYLRGYYGVYFLGLFLNTALVILLLLVMFSPRLIKGILYKAEEILVYLRLWKKSDSRKNKITSFLSGYQETVYFLQNHKTMIGVVVIATFLQRFSVFALTYVVYCGLGLNGSAMWDIILLQASIIIAVDMLPIPGAQGITEAMYAAVFKSIFPKAYLLLSMCVARGISFYLMMIVSFVVWGMVHLHRRRSRKI